jgi:pyrroloquinoline quinone biosynthesis protein B
MHLGREAASTKEINVFAMPRMLHFLRNNGPWSQLVKLKNITLQPILDNKTIQLSDDLSITAFLVPHRDEFSETVGYKIKGPNKTALFIPDIDKWQKWDKNIIDTVKQVDYAFLDATFYQNGEIPNRNMADIPHPFVQESLKLFQNMTAKNKAKIIFIHFNHSNPLLQNNSQAQKQVKAAGFNYAYQGMEFEL